MFGGGCGGSGAVGHAPDLYEFLSAVGSGATGGGKMFPVEGDDSTGAAAVSGEVRFAVVCAFGTCICFTLKKTLFWFS